MDLERNCLFHRMDLADLQEGFSPLTDSHLLKVSPKFAGDLCLPTMEKYVSAPRDMEPYPFPTGIPFEGVDYKRYGI